MSAPPMSAPLRNAQPRATLVIEWENALDAQNTWVRLALTRLQAEVERIAGREAPPPVLFVYDQEKASEEAIRALIAEVAPRLGDSGLVRLIPNPGLSYYELKNHGARLAESEFVLFVDSDTGPLPGWYDAMLEPFTDPEVIGVGGMTLLGLDTLMSRVFALTWFNPLEHEGERAERRQHAQANNIAVRRDFFLQHPFPSLTAFKQGQTVWQEDLRAAGFKIPITAKARLVHAPPTAIDYWPKRAWHEGGDRDFTVARRYGASRALRLLAVPAATLRAMGRGVGRIFAYGHRVKLPLWGYAPAVAVVLAYQLCACAGQLTSVVRHGRRREVPKRQRRPVGIGT
jgi:hypothetical protein